MKHIVTNIKETRVFYLLFFCLFLGFGFLLIDKGRAENFLALNNLHSFGLNVFFVNYTFFGDGLFTIVLLIILFYRKQNKLAFCILVAFLSSGIFVQVLKNLIYAPTPKLYFEASQYLFRLDNFGNSGGGTNNFPSSHNTAAFALATVLAIYLKKNYISILLLIAAILVGYSRIYLAQHFPIDVLVGACIGVTFAPALSLLIEWERKIYFHKKPEQNKRQLNRHYQHSTMS